MRFTAMKQLAPFDAMRLYEYAGMHLWLCLKP